MESASLLISASVKTVGKELIAVRGILHVIQTAHKGIVHVESSANANHGWNPETMTKTTKTSTKVMVTSLVENGVVVFVRKVGMETLVTCLTLDQ